MNFFNKRFFEFLNCLIIKIIPNSLLMSNKKDSSGFANSVKTFITYGVGAFIGVLIVRVIKAIIFS